MSKKFDLPNFGRMLENFFGEVSDKDLNSLKKRLEEAVGKADLDDLLDISKLLKEKMLRLEVEDITIRRKLLFVIENIGNKIVVLVSKKKHDPDFVEKTITEFQEVLGEHAGLTVLQRYKEQITRKVTA